MTRPGMNVHLYPSPITHESRIRREVESISKCGAFERIEVAGVTARGLPSQQQGVSDSTIRRFGSETSSDALTARLRKTAAFGREVLRHYSGKPVAVINCHSLPTLPVALELKRRTGAALVYDTHELETETSVAQGVRRPLLKSLERAGIRGVDHTFVVSQSIEDWYRRTYGLTAIDTLYNFPQSGALPRVEKQEMRGRLGIRPDDFLCIYQGVLGAGRGINQIIRAFANPPPGIAVLFIGYGEDEERVRKAADSHKSVYFHPAVPPERLVEYTMIADVGLSLVEPGACLSYDYAAPNKLYQYVHAGLPVIASGLVEQARFLSENRVGVVTASLQRHAIWSAISEIRDWDSIALAGELERARELTTWESYDTLIADRYQALVGARITSR